MTLTDPREQYVAKLLHKFWDPIGSGCPEDEYNDYAPGFLKLLDATAEQDEIYATPRLVRYLLDIEVGSMGLHLQHPDGDRLVNAAYQIRRAFYAKPKPMMDKLAKRAFLLEFTRCRWKHYRIEGEYVVAGMVNMKTAGAYDGQPGVRYYRVTDPEDECVRQVDEFRASFSPIEKT